MFGVRFDINLNWKRYCFFNFQNVFFFTHVQVSWDKKIRFSVVSLTRSMRRVWALRSQTRRWVLCCWTDKGFGSQRCCRSIRAWDSKPPQECDEWCQHF